MMLLIMVPGCGQARNQAGAMKPGLKHKFGNLTLFSSKICSDDIK